MPALRASIRARLSCSAASASARRWISVARSPGVTSRQAGNAALARATAASTSSTPARGTSAIGRAVAGSITERRHAASFRPQAHKEQRTRSPARARRGDQRRDDLRRLVLLRVPDDAEGEAAVGQLDRLDDLVVDRPAADLEPLPQPVHALVVVRHHQQAVGPGRPAGQRPARQPHLVGAEGAGDRAVAAVADRFGQVLVERPADRHVDQLHPAADPQHRHVALQRPPGQGQLEGVALGPGALRLRVRLGAVARRVDVGAARQEQRVDPVEQHVGIGDRDLVGRQHDRDRPRLLQRPHVVARRQRHLVAVPDPPGHALDRGADPDHRGAHATPPPASAAHQVCSNPR